MHELYQRKIKLVKRSYRKLKRRHLKENVMHCLMDTENTLNLNDRYMISGYCNIGAKRTRERGRTIKPTYYNWHHWHDMRKKKQKGYRPWRKNNSKLINQIHNDFLISK